MSTIRTARAATRTALLATAALAALTLTACEDGTGTKDEGKASASASQSASGQGSGTATPGTNSASQAGGSTKGTGTRTGKGSSGSSSGTSASGKGKGSTSSDPVICNGANTKVTAQLVSRPVNHMLLTVKNTGSKPCDLTYFPYLRFDEMQWAPGAFQESMPQSVTTLEPGASGYAGVRLSAPDGSGENGTTGHKLTVIFQGRTPRSDAGATASVALPAKGVYYDSKLTSTYWQSSATDALNW
ncbi:DUF4232 domain-containing protein [Streptomyces sp. NPDC047022]|uniref:DUF4232 domain-containing protein n=1 Tax=Streptomyces sp. NPDC047022 TaxID=3155737 RepID=UPI003410D4CB